MQLKSISYGPLLAAEKLAQIIEEHPEPRKAQRKVGRLLSAFDEVLVAIQDLPNKHAARFLFLRTVEYYEDQARVLGFVLENPKIGTFTLNVLAYKKRKFWKENFERNPSLKEM
jgi:hypothetical protein